MSSFMIIGAGEDLDEGDFYVDLTEAQIESVLTTLGANRCRPQGNNIQSDHCFLHGNDRPTLGVSVDAPHPWNCFVPHCGSKGPTILSLIAKSLRIKKIQAREWLYTHFPDLRTNTRAFTTLGGVPSSNKRRFELPEVSLAAYPLSADNDLGYRAIDYWGKCSRKEADKLGLGYDRIHHRIIFPVRHEDGTLAGLVGRTMRKNAYVRYYNYDEEFFKTGFVLLGNHMPLDKKKPIVVVEGPSDWLNLVCMGVPNVRALLGAKFTEWQVDNLVKHLQPIVPMFDLDEAGKEARKNFYKEVNKRVELWGFRYPDSAFDEEGKADPGSIAREDVGELVSSFSRGTKFRRLQ